MNWLQQKLANFTGSGHLDDARASVYSENYPAGIENATKAKAVFDQTSNDRGKVHALNLLAECHLRTNALELAESEYRQSLAICEREFAAGDLAYALELISISTGLGEIEQSASHIDEAEKHYRRAISMSDEHVGRDAPELARAMDGLGNILVEKGTNAEAETLFDRAFTAVEYPPHGFNNLLALSRKVTADYAAFLRKIGKVDEAQEVELHAASLQVANQG